MLKSNFCDYSDGYIIIKETISIANTEAAVAAANNEKKVIFKNCVPFTDCISEVSNMQTDSVKDIDNRI